MSKPDDDSAYNTPAGGCRPPTEEEAKRVPQMPKDVLDKIRARAKKQREEAQTHLKGSWVAMFNAAYPDLNQGGTGCCTACAASNAEMACALFQQNIRIPVPSWGFGYYTTTSDETFSTGSSVSWAIAHRANPAIGCCADSFYPESYVLQQFNLWPRNPFRPDQLPQPAAYADALTRRVLQYYTLPRNPAYYGPYDWSVVDDLIDTGHPIGFGLGSHAMCIIDRSDDGWWYYAKDSNHANIDDGAGRGIRAFTRDKIQADAFDLVTVMLIEPGALPVVTPPAPPTGNTQMLIDTIKADANALALGQITQAQVDKIRADVALLVPDAPAAPGVETVWVDDFTPSGAVANGQEDGWNWVASNPPPFSGTKAHQSALLAGSHQHSFTGASLQVSAGDTLFAYVYLDPANTPSEIILKWNDGTWDHRAYWGANLMTSGTDGTNSRRRIGDLPAAGQWARLEVPAALVGLEGRTVNGMAFTVFNGRATWDKAGKRAL